MDDRAVRVEASVFEPAEQHTVKLEGARLSGYETMSFTAIRDPHLLANTEDGAALLAGMLTDRVPQTFDLDDGAYRFDLRLYGHNAVLGDLDPATGPARKVGVMLLVRAPDQATATAVAKIANRCLRPCGTSRSRSGRRTRARSGSRWSCSCATRPATPSRPTRLS